MFYCTILYIVQIPTVTKSVRREPLKYVWMIFRGGCLYRETEMCPISGPVTVWVIPHWRPGHGCKGLPPDIDPLALRTIIPASWKHMPIFHMYSSDCVSAAMCQAMYDSPFNSHNNTRRQGTLLPLNDKETKPQGHFVTYLVSHN